MCTVMIALKPTPGTLLAVSGNRNEFLERAASGPALVRGEPDIWAPRDDKAGGTWLGVNGHGLFVCLTNRRHATRDAQRESRGVLVKEALLARSAAELHERMAAIPGERFNGFHLVYADLREGFVTIGDGNVLDRRALEPGMHVITERSFGAGEGPREDVCSNAFDTLFAAGEPTVESLRVPLQAHGPKEEPLESACVHAEIFGYGTRSSFQLLVTREQDVRALWTEGKPCRAPVRDVSAELAPLFRGQAASGNSS